MPESAMAEADRWDQVYAREEHLFTKLPNAFLMEVAGPLAPGRALDIGMGQGRNAIWLAGRGWDVTGLDISEEGVRQASAAPSPVRVVHESAEDFAIGEGQWDLVVGMYVHGVMLRESARVIAGLRRGGRVVVEGFHRDVMKMGIEGMTGGLLGYKTNALLRAYLGLRIERYEERVAMADWRRIEAPIVRMVGRKE
jgi:2-polyprenyl-3-methyl-5-hydroxy-6-metoxy-1,4-benzoquinol methylase